jgi:leader peptidase (prepilin peptidase) / N-methyltransferase
MKRGRLDRPRFARSRGKAGEVVDGGGSVRKHRPMLWVIVIAFGLATGSFLNVVVYRIPAGKSVVRPRSACPGCGRTIGARDNIPVVSWILLRARCRHCGMRISLRYPLVEAGTAALFVATVAIVGVEPDLPAHLWFVSVTFALALVDLDTKRLPNRILYPGAIVAVVLLAAGALFDGNGDALVRGLLGGGAYFAGLLVIAVAARGGFGFGDVKLAFLLGSFAAYHSWGALAVAVFAGFVIGGVVSVAALVAGRAGRKDTIPFGPAMVFGAWLAVAAGERIAQWYFG